MLDQMKLTSSIRQLQDAVSKVAQAIPAKSIDQRFENINLSLEPGELTLFASDGEVSITAKSGVESSDSGNIGIRARTLQDFLRSMYDTSVMFSIERQEISDHGTVSISTDKGRYRIPCLFQSKPEKQDKQYDISIEMETSEMLDLIQKTTFACSVDGMRPAMMGVLFELEGSIITAVATDGHRLVRCRKASSVDLSEKNKVVVPARVLSILQKLAQTDSVTMQFDSERKFVRFICGSIVLDAALIVEPYPNYEAVIPVEHDRNLIINRSMIYDSVRRVGRFSSIGDVKVVLEGQMMKIMAENTNEGESAQEELACEFSGEDMAIGFNSRFIEAALAHLDENEIRIELKSPTTAVIFRPHGEEENDNLIILVMPVRINN
ncbi:DNA polymerase III, beta subunit [Pelodictyon luteolum DSM 273]|uniref:Beta sliding clamp n=2 Tax=Pelodictyon luteolum TaxID=1100 RepID=Q3B6Y8_CHLL3|nr:DNA polymerase III, beta subunit [Pelodictyon luteolum DSM 273]